MREPVSVIVTTWNTLPWSRRAIRRAREEVPAGSGEIIVIDQASHDGTQAYLREALRLGLIDVLCLEEKNRGASVSRNKGVKLAKHGRVLLLDGDIIMPRNWVNLANEYLTKHPAYVAVSIAPHLCTRDEHEATHYLEDLYQVRESRTSCTNLGLYLKGYLEDVPFPEHDLFGEPGWGFEDTWQSDRGIEKGYKWAQVQDPQIKYLHPLNSSLAVLDQILGKDETERRKTARHRLLLAERRRVQEVERDTN